MQSGGAVETKRRVGRPRAQAQGEQAPAREAILKAARLLFRRQGVKATSTRQIADAAGLRQPTIFHYFPNKTEIVREIARLAVAPELAFIEQEARSALPPHVRLYRYAHFVAKNLLTNPNVIGSPLQFPELTPAEFAEFFAAYDRIFSTLREILQAGMEGGVFVELPLEATARQLFALIEAGLAEERMSQDDASRAADNAAVLVLRSVLVDVDLLRELIEVQ